MESIKRSGAFAVKKLAYILPVVALAACAMPEERGKSIADFKFNGIFGTYKGDTTTSYWLATSGWRYGGYKEDSFITMWIGAHPKARVYPLLSMTDDNKGGDKVVCCFATDGADTLNNYLVRMGSLYGGFMIWGKDDPLFAPGYHRNVQMRMKILIDDTTYNTYRDQIKWAEKYARDNKNGVWANDYKGKATPGLLKK